MADERFDLSYKGLIAPGADAEHARQRLTAIFKLTDKGGERLFTGKPVIVKRNVDAATAAKLEKVFAQAGAILTVTPVEGSEAPVDNLAESETSTLAAPQVATIDTSHLSLAPLFGFLEDEPEASVPALDLGYLSLVPGDDWTLEDCEPPPTPVPEPDLSYLSLEPTPEGSDRETDPRLD